MIDALVLYFDKMGVCEYDSMAESYLPLFQVLAFNPFLVSALYFVMWLLFVAIMGPLWLVSFAITTWGAVLLLCLIILLLARYTARSMAFPGAVKSMQRHYAHNFMYRNTLQLQDISDTAAKFSKTIVHMASNIAPDSAGGLFFGKENLKDLMGAVEYLATMSLWVEEALEDVLSTAKGEAAIKELQEELTSSKSLKSATKKLSESLKILHDEASGVLEEAPDSFAATSKGRVISMVIAANTCTFDAEALKTAAISARPPTDDLHLREEVEGTTKTFMSTVNSIRYMNRGPQGAGKLSFGIMRAQLKTVFHAERNLLTGVDGNVIDMIYIPNIRCSLKQEEATEKERTAARGTVLFCGPNAGLYELVSQLRQDNSWFGYYQKFGFDVCCWNYRGYNGSTGIPSPQALKVDGATVVKFLREKKHVVDLIVHGESIGGMVACHIAANTQPPPQLLVADRTFASLDSTASHLMGRWAGVALRYIGLWRSDVVSDYLNASCPKVILQDPDDEIIRGSASLKNGLATKMILGENLWSPVKNSAEYRRAEIMGLPVPKKLYQFSNEAVIDHKFISHLIACILDVAACAARNRRSRQALRELGDEMSVGAISNPILSNNLDRDDDSLFVISPPNLNRTPSDIEAAVEEASGDTFVEIELTSRNLDIVGRGSDKCKDDSRQGTSSALDDVVVLTAETGLRSRSRSNSLDSEADIHSVSSKESSHSNSNKSNQASSDKKKLSSPQRGNASVDSNPAYLTLVEKVWMTLARTDGGTGQSLIQAWCGKYDGIRSWICSLLVWKKRSMTYVNPQFISVRDAAMKLEVFLASNTSKNHDDAPNREAIEFIKDSFLLLARLSESEDLQLSGTTVRPQIRLGNVIPLHCGHNGWPGKASLKALEECLHNAGLAGLARSSTASSGTSQFHSVEV